MFSKATASYIVAVPFLMFTSCVIPPADTNETDTPAMPTESGTRGDPTGDGTAADSDSSDNSADSTGTGNDSCTAVPAPMPENGLNWNEGGQASIVMVVPDMEPSVDAAVVPIASTFESNRGVRLVGAETILEVQPGDAPVLRGSIPANPGMAQSNGTSFAQVGDGDDRSIVGSAELEQFPSSAVVAIVDGGSMANICSGVLVGPIHVLTAAHCLYDADSGSFYDPETMLVAPGLDGISPFEDTHGTFEVNSVYVAQGYQDAESYGEGRAHDYGLIILEQGNRCLGWFGMQQNGASAGVDVVSAQYPGAGRACAAGPDGLCAGHQYTQPCSLVESNSAAEMIGHECDTNPGSSGSTLYVPQNEDFSQIQTVAIHSGVGSVDEGPNNAFPISTEAISAICSWIGNHPTEGDEHACYR